VVKYTGRFVASNLTINGVYGNGRIELTCGPDDEEVRPTIPLRSSSSSPLTLLLPPFRSPLLLPLFPSHPSLSPRPSNSQWRDFTGKLLRQALSFLDGYKRFEAHIADPSVQAEVRRAWERGGGGEVETGSVYRWGASGGSGDEDEEGGGGEEEDEEEDSGEEDSGEEGKSDDESGRRPLHGDDEDIVGRLQLQQQQQQEALSEQRKRARDRERERRERAETDQGEEKSETVDKDTCKICFSASANSVIIPCGHMCACMNCGVRLDKCPICRSEINRIQEVFRA
jgi:hypothetical protein